MKREKERERVWLLFSHPTFKCVFSSHYFPPPSIPFLIIFSISTVSSGLFSNIASLASTHVHFFSPFLPLQLFCFFTYHNAIFYCFLPLFPHINLMTDQSKIFVVVEAYICIFSLSFIYKRDCTCSSASNIFVVHVSSFLPFTYKAGNILEYIFVELYIISTFLFIYFHCLTSIHTSMHCTPSTTTSPMSL